MSASPSLETVDQTAIFNVPARRIASLSDADIFNFFGQSGELSAVGWREMDGLESRSKLWRYNQHYFDDLNALNAAERSAWHWTLLQRWVAENKPGDGVGWDPYPTSLRIVNWLKWHCRGNTLPDICVESLIVQTRWLMQRIEWHILGNHLLANGKALIFAGLFFSGKESDRWLRMGLKIVTDQLPEQVLADGGHFERSPMYHSIVLEDILDLLNFAQAFPVASLSDAVADWRKVAERMLNWLNGMIHPDSEISFFNDAAIGIAPQPIELFFYARRLGLVVNSVSSPVTHFPDSGYLRLALTEALLFVDVAPVGPDYLPGHAHADTLSFELSLFGQRVFVNGGTSEYGTGEIRLDQRSTWAHSTVVINGENSSEVWSSFRVARRAYPDNLLIEETRDSVFVSCAHDGYSRLPGKPIHMRTWEFSESSLIISDLIDGDYEQAIAYFHVHPAVGVSSADSGSWLLQLPQGPRVLVNVEIGDSEWSPSYYAPEFGKRLDTQCLTVVLKKEGARVRIRWNGFE